MKVALVPALDEEEHIAMVVLKASKYMDKVIVCDDGSKDLTGAIAERMGAVVIRHDSNLGKGVAISDLFKAAQNMDADVAVSIDADGQHDPDEIPNLIAPVQSGEADVVIGSREIGDSMPDHRKAGNRLLTGMTNVASGGKVKDSQSGYRAYSRKALRIVKVAEHGIGVDSQILVDAFNKGLKVVEVPVKVSYGENTSTYGPTRHGLYVVVTLMRTVTERSPLLYLGVPSLVLVAAGILFGVDLSSLYASTHYFSVPLALLALGLLFVGLILAVGAMLLYAVNNLAVRLRRV